MAAWDVERAGQGGADGSAPPCPAPPAPHVAMPA